jgi:hypothetical protein
MSAFWGRADDGRTLFNFRFWTRNGHADRLSVGRTTQIGSANPTTPVPSQAKSDGLTHPGRGALKWQIAVAR